MSLLDDSLIEAACCNFKEARLDSCHSILAGLSVWIFLLTRYLGDDVVSLHPLFHAVLFDQTPHFSGVTSACPHQQSPAL